MSELIKYPRKTTKTYPIERVSFDKGDFTLEANIYIDGSYCVGCVRDKDTNNMVHFLFSNIDGLRNIIKSEIIDIIKEFKSLLDAELGEKQ